MLPVSTATTTTSKRTMDAGRVITTIGLLLHRPRKITTVAVAVETTTVVAAEDGKIIRRSSRAGTRGVVAVVADSEEADEVVVAVEVPLHRSIGTTVVEGLLQHSSGTTVVEAPLQHSSGTTVEATHHRGSGTTVEAPLKHSNGTTVELVVVAVVAEEEETTTSVNVPGRIAPERIVTLGGDDRAARAAF
jgi:hypothetical protein